ncbi:oryzin, partial [Colletotrichum cereale]
VQSLINGPDFGTAKEADLVVVKLGPRFQLVNVILGLTKVYRDVLEKKLQGKAVVNLSLGDVLLKSVNVGQKPGFDNPEGVEAYRSILQLLINEDVVVVAASGNARDEPGGSEVINAFPAFLGREMDILAVGAVDEKGRREDYSQGLPRELDTSAVGTVLCANNADNVDDVRHRTSFAAPLVTGMIAVLLSQKQHKKQFQVPGKVAANVKKLVRDLSYNRFGGGDTPVAWNGVDAFKCDGGTGSGKLRVRGRSCDIASSSTSMMPTSTAPPSTFLSLSLPATTTAPPPPPPTTAVAPVPCYNFNVNAYGFCCPDAESTCKNGAGTCYLPFKGEGVGGGGDGITTVPTGARSPPPPGGGDTR